LQSDSKQPVVDAPASFSPAAKELGIAQVRLEALAEELGDSINIHSPAWQEYLSWIQAYDTANAEQLFIENEIERTGELKLESGHSYSFDLESYCVQGATSRPVSGDGLRMAPIQGQAEYWLPQILAAQAQKKLAQDRVQYLIWALLYDVRFDELSEENQATLRFFFPDAAVRFGNRRVENAMLSALPGLLPESLSDRLSTLAGIRERVIELRESYSQLASELAPISSRIVPIPVGWLKMDEGYLLHATADSFTRIHIDIQVPKEDVERVPSSLKQRVFRPSQWIALPAHGQRLAMSNRVIHPSILHLKHNSCKKAQSWKPRECHAMKDVDRNKLMSLADPVNFPHTRYQSPPRSPKTEDSTDCSHFVNEMMRRAGFEYPYAPTRDIECLRVFKTVPESDARIGDIILYSGHIGLLDASGRVISATEGGKARRSRLEPNDPAFLPSITRLSKQDAGHGRWKIFRWSCP
jgi:hypothetical protein